MRLVLTLVLGWLLFWPMLGRSQGDFLYDQISPFPGTPSGGGAAWGLEGSIGQSFTPSFSTLDFIELRTGDGVPGNRLGGTVYVVLRSDSITGPIVSSTDPVYLPDGFGLAGDKTVRFYFPTSLSLTPQQMYYFQVAAKQGTDSWYVVGYHWFYPGGHAYWGTRAVDMNLWFRTGIVVPEPSTAVLVLLGLPALIWTLGRNSSARLRRVRQEKPTRR